MVGKHYANIKKFPSQKRILKDLTFLSIKYTCG